jgi:hypothetical protein
VAEDDEGRDHCHCSTLVQVLVDIIDIIQRMVQSSLFKDQMGFPELVMDTIKRRRNRGSQLSARTDSRIL